MTPARLSDDTVADLIDKYLINTDVVPFDVVKKAIQTEMEHHDIIGYDPEYALRIALAHLREFPDYYQRLSRMEHGATQFWEHKKHANIYTYSRR